MIKATLKGDRTPKVRIMKGDHHLGGEGSQVIKLVLMSSMYLMMTLLL